MIEIEFSYFDFSGVRGSNILYYLEFCLRYAQRKNIKLSAILFYTSLIVHKLIFISLNDLRYSLFTFTVINREAMCMNNLCILCIIHCSSTNKSATTF